ncbi:MAG: DAK2 domain-containing protein [Dethiobacteria bacterium]|nr:DAK2 domain-containing protein [Bacillota bacterium]HOP69336.1 DAK2 domain-containing protein [Bacillota bacterium]HPT34712.1 DAK2 domain-containing protein [Bacillota bacterium]HPZ64939.1 DAK2 domain-containing protein [Bacillota bacterium]
MIHTLQGKHLKNMLGSGAMVLAENEEMVNNLNVFPVPDGDTGTNMRLTLQAAVKALEGAEGKTAGEVAKIIADSTLRGARGNSGVILSQLLRGFAEKVAGKDELTPGDFAAAMEAGVITAYNAVMRPVEGTILSVAKAAAMEAARAARKKMNFLELLAAVCESARLALEQTPRQLKVLRDAGVVDSGGQGLLCLFQGFYAYMEKVWQGEEESIISSGLVVDPVQARGGDAVPEGEEIRYGYCTELLLKGEHLSADTLRRELSRLGDSVLVVGDEKLLKVHLHTDAPGEVLTLCSRWGEMDQIKVDNMREMQRQKAARAESSDPGKKLAVVAVANGPGLAEIFTSLGADAVIAGGPTMNPSTDDFVKVIQKLEADKIIILPNNKNIILAAQQAESLLEGKELLVAPTRTIPQGISVLVQLDRRETSLEKIARRMEAQIAAVKSAAVTQAVRSTTMNGKTIEAGDWLGLLEETLAVVEKDRETVVQKLLKALVQDGDEVVTVYYGEDVSPEEIEGLAQYMEEEFPDQELEIYEGGQPFYPYYISVE